MENRRVVKLNDKEITIEILFIFANKKTGKDYVSYTLNNNNLINISEIDENFNLYDIEDEDIKDVMQAYNEAKELIIKG